MPILQQQDEEAVKQRFDDELEGEVKIKLFTYDSIGGLLLPGRECQTCEPTRQLLEEVCELSDQISLDVVDFYANPEEAKAYAIQRIPAIVISGNDNANVKYYGLPSGYEFAVLVDTIINTASEQSLLEPDTLAALSRLKEDVHIQVFVTPQ